MNIITVNVGQGSLAIIRHEGEAIVVDARMPPASDDTVASVKRHLAKFLDGHYLRGVIITGLDVDHCDVRCLAILLRKYRPEWVLIPDYAKDTECSQDVVDLLDSETVDRIGTRSPLEVMPIAVDRKLPNVERLSPKFSFDFFSPRTSDMTSSNNSSLVVRVTGNGQNGFSYLVTGDTENARWESINRDRGPMLGSDVMAAPHHGARNATNAQTLLLVAPNTILISAGVDNPYGHPDGSVLSAYARVAQHVFGTHVDGGCSLYTERHGDDFRTIAFAG